MHRIEVTPDGTKLYSENEADTFACVIDLKARKRSKKIPAMQQSFRCRLVLRLHLIRPGNNPMEEAADGRESDAGQSHRLENALPHFDKSTDMRLVRQTSIERRPISVMQNVHHMRAAHLRRIIEPGILQATGLEIHDPRSPSFLRFTTWRHRPFRRVSWTSRS